MYLGLIRQGDVNSGAKRFTGIVQVGFVTTEDVSNVC